jgi:hypothetical protein
VKLKELEKCKKQAMKLLILLKYIRRRILDACLIFALVFDYTYEYNDNIIDG